jgi:putative ABC transport system permease protein
VQTMRTRLQGFVGAFVALTFAVAIVTACGILLESGARARAPVERYAGTPVVVAGKQSLAVNVDGEEQSIRLPERVRIPAALARRVAAIDGVDAVIAARSRPRLRPRVAGFWRLRAAKRCAPTAGAAPS